VTDTKRLVRHLDSLVSHYYHHAGEDTRVVITNLTGIYRYLSDVVAAQARELDHWARAARDAEDERDEALVQVGELRDELDELVAVRVLIQEECPVYPRWLTDAIDSAFDQIADLVGTDRIVLMTNGSDGDPSRADEAHADAPGEVSEDPGLSPSLGEPASHEDLAAHIYATQQEWLVYGTSRLSDQIATDLLDDYTITLKQPIERKNLHVH
jgi:hypothetical protein